jgi:hypothetical protein
VSDGAEAAARREDGGLDHVLGDVRGDQRPHASTEQSEGDAHNSVTCPVRNDIQVGERSEAQFTLHERLGHCGQPMEREHPGQRTEHRLHILDAEESRHNWRPQPDRSAEDCIQGHGRGERCIDVPALELGSLHECWPHAELRNDAG